MGKNKFIIGIIIVVLIIVNLSGCTEEKAIETKGDKNVFLESDILELVDSSLDFTEGNGQIIKAEVSFRCRNLLDNVIKILYYDVEFCDKDGNILYVHEDKTISNFPARYTESTPNICQYFDDDTKYTDHVYIRVTDYEI